MDTSSSSPFLNALFYGALTLVIYYFLVMRPGAAARQREQDQQQLLLQQRVGTAAATGQTPDTAARGAGGTNGLANQGGDGTTAAASCLDSGLKTSQQEPHEPVRVPIHVSDASAKIATPGGFSLLTSDGLVAFRHGKAFAMEQSLDTDAQTANRKDRARVLSRLLADETLTTPPNKGSTIVVSVPIDNSGKMDSLKEGCSKIRRVLYLLATNYNVLLILALQDTAAANSVTKDFKKEQELRSSLISSLRGKHNNETIAAPQTDGNPDDGKDFGTDTISSDILPDHRIIISTTVAGRVAFVRQLQRVEVIIDFETEVRNLLSRFGHKVIILSQQNGSNGNESKSCECSSSTKSTVCLGCLLLS